MSSHLNLVIVYIVLILSHIIVTETSELEEKWDKMQSMKSSLKKSSSQKPVNLKRGGIRCEKCNRNNHHTKECYAKTRVDDEGNIIAVIANDLFKGF